MSAASFLAIQDLLFTKLSSRSEITASVSRTLHMICTAVQLQEFLNTHNWSEDDFDAVAWIQIQLGLNHVESGLLTPNPTQINLGPIFSPSTIPASNHSTAFPNVEYLSPLGRALLKGNVGTSEYTKELALRLKIQRNQAQTPIETGHPILPNVQKPSFIKYISNYRQYKLDGGVGGFIEGLPQNLRAGIMIEISDGLPIDPILKRPPKWNEISEHDLITLILNNYDSAHVRDSESAMFLFYALRMLTLVFDLALLTEYFAAIAELLENYPAAMATVGIPMQIKFFLQYIQPPAFRSMLKAQILQCTAWHQVWPIAKDLREKFHFHQLIEIEIKRLDAITFATLKPIQTADGHPKKVDPSIPHSDRQSNNATFQVPADYPHCDNCKALPNYRAHTLKRCNAACNLPSCNPVPDGEDPHKARNCTGRKLQVAKKAHMVKAGKALVFVDDDDSYDYELNEDDD